MLDLLSWRSSDLLVYNSLAIPPEIGASLKVGQGGHLLMRYNLQNESFYLCKVINDAKFKI